MKSNTVLEVSLKSEHIKSNCVITSFFIERHMVRRLWSENYTAEHIILTQIPDKILQKLLQGSRNTELKQGKLVLMSASHNCFLQCLRTYYISFEIKCFIEKSNKTKLTYHY